MRQKIIGAFSGEKLIPLCLNAERKHRKKDDDDIPFWSLNPAIIDESKILQSKGLRRLQEKTQVHCKLRELNQHIRNRLTHTHEVTAVSVEIAGLLGLNVDFCRAIALAHDIGHPPYGHLGEKVLGIKHAFNGAIVLQEVERKGAGLNLCKETVKAIMYHSKDNLPLSLDKNLPNEINVLILADKIAYTFSDINDFKRVGMLEERNLPEEVLKLGKGPNAQRMRIASCVRALVEESLEKGKVSFQESREAKIFKEIRDWMYRNMYNPLDSSNERLLMKDNLAEVLMYLQFSGKCGNLEPRFVASLMTDKETNVLANLLRKEGATKEEMNELFNSLSISEIIRSLKGKEIDHTKNPLW